MARNRILRRSSKTTNANPSFRYRIKTQKADTTKDPSDIITPLIIEPSEYVSYDTTPAPYKQLSYQEITKVAQPYDFKTKQRPFEYTYFSREYIRILAFATPQNLDIVISNIGSRKMLIINHVSVDVSTLLTAVGPPARIWTEQYPSNELLGLKFDVSSTTTKLYDAESQPFSVENTSFTKIGENVLSNGDSSTSLYVFENSAVIWRIRWNPLIGAPPAPVAGATQVRARLNLRGHLTTMSEYFELKDLKKFKQ